MAQMNHLQNITDIENRLVVTKGEESRGGKDWEYGISRCKLSCNIQDGQTAGPIV